MLLVVIVLAVTNAVTLTALVLLYRYLDRPSGRRPDAVVASALDAAPAPAGTGPTRRIVSVEVLNPIELAGSRGRLAGLAGSIVPRLTRRIVHDQVLKILKEQLVAQQVVADVRLHTVRPSPPPEAPKVYADEVAPVDLGETTD